MNPIEAIIRLHTIQQDQGTYINALILQHQGNNYHLIGRTGDLIYVFRESICLYVLTINPAIGYVGLNCYMTPESDPINSIYLHTYKEIKETLGPKWEGMKPVAIVMRLACILL